MSSSINSTIPPSQRSTTVNPNSVQNQFASLVQSKDNLRQLLQSTEQEYLQERTRLANLTQNQAALSEQISRANAQLGIQRKKKDLVVGEKERLKALMKREREEMEGLTEKYLEVQRQEEKKKEEFVKQMDDINVELMDVLRRYEESNVQTWITESSVKEILTFLNSKVGVQDPLEQWVNLQMVTKDTVKEFVDACHTKEESVKEKQSLVEQCAHLRAKILGAQNVSTEGIREMELDELERIWESHPCDENTTSTTAANDRQLNPTTTTRGGEPSSMDLFYGVDNTCDSLMNNQGEDVSMVIDENDNAMMGSSTMHL